MQPHDLPVYQQRDRILQALETDQVIVVESPTGSGKTTQLPIILHEAGYGRNGTIGVTQPRRIAAVSVCEYIARQLDEAIGETVGYKMRFEDRTGPETRLKVMTDGILLQEIKLDYELLQYGVIIVDEAHERSLNIDFILGLLKRVLRARPEFKVIVSSATINAEVFSEYFDSCPVVRIETPMYPVQLVYDPPVREQDPDELVSKITDVVGRIMEEEREGDILIFLSGERIIKDTVAALYSEPYRGRLYILPLYGRLSKEEQEAVFPPAPEGKTKIVVSTNIAETSVTIDGITTVIDSGLAKMNYYNPKSFTSSLIEGPISKAGANQRKGRAGRTQPGTCYRLYRRDDYERRPLFTTEEIYRTDLSEVVLRMAEIGITDFDQFDFISSPGRQGIVSAVESLHLLDALEPNNALSQIGQMMAQFPLLPRHSRVIVEAIMSYPDVMDDAVTAAAFLSTNSPFLLPMGEEIEARQAHHRYRDDLGDFVSYLKLFAAYVETPKKERFCESRYLDPQTMGEIRNVKEQLAEVVSAMGIPLGHGGSRADYLCAVAKGLIQFVCVQTGRGSYRSLTAERILIHPGSVMFRESPRFIVAGEIVRTSRTYARSVSPLEESWIKRISPVLAESLMEHEPGHPPQSRKKRQRQDTTWQIKIGAYLFPLRAKKGKKKIALLSWDELKAALKDDPVVLPQYHSLRGKLVHKGVEILSGMKVAEIMRVAQYIDPSRDVVSEWPRTASYDSYTAAAALCSDLDTILKMTRTKKSGKAVGFLTLQTDGNGLYWFKPQRNFYTAVAESLAALEQLADELGSEVEQSSHDAVNAAYRRLSGILDEESAP
ncbi:MAG: helicase-related protein [Spirochaetota bacterium]